tara:strand:+ start:16 stop:939 length:924 start_codon:yes stop_codon:yes gene_type:complete
MPLVKVQSRGTQNVGSGRNNLIMNPFMEIAQRGTSASSKTASGYYTCDRWRTEASGATFNTSQQSNTASDMATTGAKHFLRMEVTTANNNSGISQKIEARNIRQFKGQKLTLSFYAKGTNPYGGSFDVVRFFSDDSTASTQEKSSLTVTSSFVKYTYTFDYPDEGSVTMTDANAKMALSFLQPDGDTSTNAWTLDITAVQLEVGTQASDIRYRSFEEELNDCRRYFQALGNFGTGDVTANRFYNADYVNIHSFIRATYSKMRVQPNIDYTEHSGTMHTDYSTNGMIQLYYSSDTNVRITEVTCEAEL